MNLILNSFLTLTFTLTFTLAALIVSLKLTINLTVNLTLNFIFKLDLTLTVTVNIFKISFFKSGNRMFNKIKKLRIYLLPRLKDHFYWQSFYRCWPVHAFERNRHKFEILQSQIIGWGTSENLLRNWIWLKRYLIIVN